jgi:Secretory lipase
VQFPFKTLASYSTVADPLSYPTVAPVLAEDTLGQSKPTSAPIYDYHGDFDEVVPVTQDDTLVSNWCAAGATIDEVRDVFAEHVLAALEEDSNVLNFLSARFAGSSPPTNTC